MASFIPAILVLSLSGDIHPNPGPLTPQTDQAKLKKKNNANHNDAHSHHPSLCSDLQSRLRITQWNLRSLAPSINNTKLDEIKLQSWTIRCGQPTEFGLEWRFF